ncbi:MAG TPA: SurA N-terminal domain-containing protein [Albidovulum sp.]|uniref:SurA N-terminal domain-containing protein n=1 Tax=Albidovulum sp. TaxID=1872424 RepID=UPI002CBDA54A|nr:SurA N-terminal domain-containing protein [Albidovulum sp.]
MSTPLRSKKRGNTLIWTIMALIMLGLGGFGATNFGGSTQSIGGVGDHEIDLRDYARAVQREMQATSAQIGKPVNFAMAQQMGIDQSVLARLLASAALEGEADRLGLSVGDSAVRDRLKTFTAFNGIDGKFDREAYKLALQREGLTEGDFESKLRNEAARTILQSAALGATTSPAILDDRITAWATETRDFTLAELIPSDLPAPVAAPTEEQLKTYYDAHPEPYTRPETRRITYVWLSPDMLADKVQLDEAALRKSYDERIKEFVTPERRLVEKLVYPDMATAEAAKARLDKGEVDFAGLAKERGLELSDVDLGEVSKEDLGAAGDAVFTLTAPGIAGPIDTDLGPALFSMNGILDTQEVSFEEARDDLSSEAKFDQARRTIAQENDKLQDLLASGATLEEVTKESEMQLFTIAFDATTQDGIAAYAPFREAALKAKDGDFPTLTALDDGGVFALRLDGIDPPALKPLDEVRDQVVADWTKAETQAALGRLATDTAAKLSDPALLESSGLVTTRYDDFARGGFIDGAPPEVAQKVFVMAPGKTDVVEAAGKVFLVGLRQVNAADLATPEIQQFHKQVNEQLSQALSQDMFQLFTQTIETRAGIQIDQAAVAAVNAQMN